MHYPVEMYIKALERMAIEFQESSEPPEEDKDIFKYVQQVLHRRGRNCASKFCYLSIARMLQMSPEVLYTTYPDYFPDPAEGGGDAD